MAAVQQEPLQLLPVEEEDYEVEIPEGYMEVAPSRATHGMVFWFQFWFYQYYSHGHGSVLPIEMVRSWDGRSEDGIVYHVMYLRVITDEEVNDAPELVLFEQEEPEEEEEEEVDDCSDEPIPDDICQELAVE